MAKPSDFTRSERRRQQKLSSKTERERRASQLADVLAAIEVHPEDEDIRDELNRLSNWIRERGRLTPEDDQRAIIRAVQFHGCHTIPDIIDETGLPEPIVRRMLNHLLFREVLAIQKFGSRKLFVMNDFTVLAELKVA